MKKKIIQQQTRYVYCTHEPTTIADGRPIVSDEDYDRFTAGWLDPVRPPENYNRMLGEFVRAAVQVDDKGFVTVQQLVAAYFTFCEQRAWTPLTERQVANQLMDAMAKCHGVRRRNDLPGDRGTSVRGFRGVKLLPHLP